MDICLHLGVHRTGTTTFQTLLGRNRDVLRGADIFSWGPHKLRGGMLDGLIKQPDYVGADDVARGNASVLRIRREMLRMASDSGARHLIVSEENMIGTMTDNLVRQSLYSQTRARLTRLAPAFSHARRVAISMRSYDSYWASVLAFKIKAGAGMADANTLDRLTHQPRRWRDVVGDVAKAFPNAEIMVMAFEQVAHDPMFILAAQTGMAVDLPPLTVPARCNASLSAGELALILAKRNDAQVATLATMSKRFQPFNATQIAKMRDDYSDDLNWLAAGADGYATFINPTLVTMTGRDTSGTPTDTYFTDRQGHHHDGCENRLDRTGRKRTTGPPIVRPDVA